MAQVKPPSILSQKSNNHYEDEFPARNYNVGSETTLPEKSCSEKKLSFSINNLLAQSDDEEEVDVENDHDEDDEVKSEIEEDDLSAAERTEEESAEREERVVIKVPAQKPAGITSTASIVSPGGFDLSPWLYPRHFGAGLGSHASGIGPPTPFHLPVPTNILASKFAGKRKLRSEHGRTMDAIRTYCGWTDTNIILHFWLRKDGVLCFLRLGIGHFKCA